MKNYFYIETESQSYKSGNYPGIQENQLAAELCAKRHKENVLLFCGTDHAKK